MTRLSFPATLRNRDALLDVLRRYQPGGRVLEVASGSGEHAVHFAGALPGLVWQPTDADPVHLASIDAWRAFTELPNVLPALALDVTGAWPDAPFDAIFCANMVHIAPFRASVALFAGAAGVLSPGAPLLTYGPYRRGGRHTSASNATFDESLRARDPSWGVRDTDELQAVALGFTLEEVVEMPANNLILVWRRHR